MQAFRNAGCPVVLLDVPLRVILLRLEHDTTRPLLQRQDKKQAAQQLYDKRLPLYRAAATLTVSAAQFPVQTAAQIAAALGITNSLH